MAGKIILTLLSLSLMSGSLNAFKFYFGTNEQYNALCAQYADVPYSAVSVLPVDPCNLQGYVLCSGGSGTAYTECSYDWRFNSGEGGQGFCDLATNVEAPAGCGSTPSTVPTDCSGTGIYSFAVPETCKNYTQCVNGNEYLRQCQQLAYFNLESRTCEYIIEPYRQKLSEDFIAECNDKDPYVDADGKAIP